MNKNAIKKLALDIYKNNISTFITKDGETADANDALRQLLIEQCGGTWSYRNFKKVSNEFFEILETILSANMDELTLETFEPIMNIQNTAYGDRMDFIVDDEGLFEVSIIANGTDNLYRQRMNRGRVPTTAFDLGLAIY